MQVVVLRCHIIRKQGIALKRVREDRIVVDIDQPFQFMMERLVLIIETLEDRIAAVFITVLYDIVLVEDRAGIVIDLILSLGAVHMRLAERLHGYRL